ncbi:MAG: oligosaccharide flippase family protein [Pseudohongiella sp.]|nr:oligosaccharide flippase family protein [Pseudohongiella sp.]
MHQAIHRALEIGVARIAPGLINVASFLLLADTLELGDYGIFSTSIATAGLIVSLVYGPIKFSILPLHAEYAAQGDQKGFETSLLGLALLVSLVLICVAAIGFLLDDNLGWLVVIVISMGMASSLQPALHARGQFWRYGTVDLTQATIWIALVLTWVAEVPAVSTALMAYAASLAISFMVAWLLVGRNLPTLPKLQRLKKIFAVGVPFTAGNMAENVIFLGFRYLLLLFGNANLLGTFSLCVDLAQRTVGVVINLFSFTILPRAYKELLTLQPSVFFKTLGRAAIQSGVIALGVMAGIIIISSVEWFAALQPPVFSITAFAIISAATITNRLKKLLIDPISVYKNRSGGIAIGYFIAGPLALLSAAIALNFAAAEIFYLSYFLGYLLAAAITTSYIRPLAAI